MLAAQGIAVGDVDIVVAGGMESMSNCPYILPKVREGLRMCHGSVIDLMIHDVDIVLSLVHSDVEAIEAVGVPVLTGRVDIANARLRFANGCIANLTASRISRERVRKIRFFQPATYLSIDYAGQKLELWRLEYLGDGDAL
jgi:predicted dehydrogenase